MSILIPGMKMPTSCSICPFVDDDFCEDYFGLCCSLTKERPYGNERLNSCPLIELPPHGDLVDRDRILKSDDIETLYDALRYVPTIIPADGGADG